MALFSEVRKDSQTRVFIFPFRKVAFFQKTLINWPPLQATVLGARRRGIREPAGPWLWGVQF